MAKRPIQAPATNTLLQLKVTLEGSRPSIWRSLLVPADIKLSNLHAVLQTSMGWEQCHLHCFHHGGLTYEPKTGGKPGIFSFLERSRDEAKVSLVELVNAQDEYLVYEYDFGDCWQHEILVEKVMPIGDGGVRRARCLAGERACPPEDCGGLPGFDHLLEVMANRKHPEYRDMLDWLGERFDPKAFDAARVDKELLEIRL